MLEGTSALCFQALMCSDVLLPCVWKGLEVFCCVSALCFAMFGPVQRCFRLVSLKVSKRSAVLLHYAFNGFDAFGGVSVLCF